MRWPATRQPKRRTGPRTRAPVERPGVPQTTRRGAVAPTDAAKEPAPPPSVTVIGARDAHGILGREVRSAANEDMGRVVDVIVEIKAGFVAGNLDIVTGDVERLSGRRPRPLRDVLSTALA